MEEAGQALAADVEKALSVIKYRGTAQILSRTRTLDLPYRSVTEDEIRGKIRGIQRFGEPGFYDKTQDLVLEEMKREGTAKAEVQAILIDDLVHVSIPAEYFVQHGLRIKGQTWPRRTRVVGYANGMLGYVPHREAFAHGGYETTFGYRSKLAPEAGDLLAEVGHAGVEKFGSFWGLTATMFSPHSSRMTLSFTGPERTGTSPDSRHSMRSVRSPDHSSSTPVGRSSWKSSTGLSRSRCSCGLRASPFAAVGGNRPSGSWRRSPR